MKVKVNKVADDKAHLSSLRPTKIEIPDRELTVLERFTTISGGYSAFWVLNYNFTKVFHSWQLREWLENGLITAQTVVAPYTPPLSMDSSTADKSLSNNIISVGVWSVFILKFFVNGNPPSMWSNKFYLYNLIDKNDSFRCVASRCMQVHYKCKRRSAEL